MTHLAKAPLTNQVQDVEIVQCDLLLEKRACIRIVNTNHKTVMMEGWGYYLGFVENLEMQLTTNELILFTPLQQVPSLQLHPRFQLRQFNVNLTPI